MKQLGLVLIGCLAVFAGHWVRHGQEGWALLATSVIAAMAAIELVRDGVSQLKKR